jgi:hypothetical protein
VGGPTRCGGDPGPGQEGQKSSATSQASALGRSGQGVPKMERAGGTEDSPPVLGVVAPVHGREVVLLPLSVGEEGNEPGVLRAPSALVVGVEEERSDVKAALAGAGQAGAMRREEGVWLYCQVGRLAPLGTGEEKRRRSPVLSRLFLGRALGRVLEQAPGALFISPFLPFVN